MPVNTNDSNPIRRATTIKTNQLVEEKVLGEGAGAVTYQFGFITQQNEENEDTRQVKALCIEESGENHLVVKMPKENSVLDVGDEGKIADHLSQEPTGNYTLQKSVVVINDQGKEIQTVISRLVPLIVIPKTATRPAEFICSDVEKLLKEEAKNLGKNKERIQDPQNLIQQYLASFTEDLDLILFQMAYGIHKSMLDIHVRNVLHLDISLRNCLATTVELKDNVPVEFSALLTDYGLSKFMVDGQVLNLPNVGPLRWMDPYRLGSRAATITSDYYAFRVLLFEIIAGLTGDYQNLFRILKDNDGKAEPLDVCQFAASKGWNVMENYTGNAYHLTNLYPRAKQFFNLFKDYLTPFKGLPMAEMTPAEREKTLVEKEKLFVDKEKIHEFFIESLKTKFKEFLDNKRNLYSFLRAINMLMKAPIKDQGYEDDIYKLCQEIASYPLTMEFIDSNPELLKRKIAELKTKLLPEMQLEEDMLALENDYLAMYDKSNHLNIETTTTTDLAEINLQNITDRCDSLQRQLDEANATPKIAIIRQKLNTFKDRFSGDADHWNAFANFKKDILQRDLQHYKTELVARQSRYQIIKNDINTKPQLEAKDIVATGEALGHLRQIQYLENAYEENSKQLERPIEIEKTDAQKEKQEWRATANNNPKLLPLLTELENNSPGFPEQTFVDLISAFKKVHSINNILLNLGFAKYLIENKSKDDALIHSQIKNLNKLELALNYLKETLKKFPHLSVEQIFGLANLKGVHLDASKVEQYIVLANKIDALQTEVANTKHHLETKQKKKSTTESNQIDTQYLRILTPEEQNDINQKIQKMYDDEKNFISKVKALLAHYDSILRDRGNVLSTPQRIFLSHFLAPYRAIAKCEMPAQADNLDTVINLLRFSAANTTFRQAVEECVRNQRGFNLLVEKLEATTGKAPEMKELIAQPMVHETQINKNLQTLSEIKQKEALQGLIELIPHAEALRKEQHKNINKIQEKTQKHAEVDYLKKIGKKIRATQNKRIEVALKQLMNKVDELYRDKKQNKKIKQILEILAHYAKHQKGDKMGLVRANKVLEVFVNLTSYTKYNVINFYLAKKIQNDVDINTHRNTAHTYQTTLAKYLTRLQIAMSEEKITKKNIKTKQAVPTHVAAKKGSISHTRALHASNNHLFPVSHKKAHMPTRKVRFANK